MKKFLFLFLLAAAVASAFTFVVAQEDQGEEKKFVIHGEIRQRADYNDNFSDFDDDINDSFLMYPYRARIAAEGHFSKDVMGYAEFQAFGVWGDTPPERGGFSTITDNSNAFNPSFGQNNLDQNLDNTLLNTFNTVELYQAWVGLQNIGGSKFSLKVGRQELVKGSEMLLGDLDFYSGISHDGLVGCFDWDSIDLDLWWTRPREQSFIAPGHNNANFYGGWLDFKKIPNRIGVAAYAMFFQNGLDAGVVDETSRDFWTIGGRANRDAETGKNGFAWNAELAFQTGSFNNTGALGETGDISAWAFEGMFGYNLHAGDSDHLFQVKYVTATGNSDPADPDKAEAFDPLFQDYHMRYGLSDVVRLSDLTALSLGWNMHMKDHYFGADYWMYELTEDVLDVNGDKQSDLGSEVDAWWKFQYNPNTQFMAGLAYFMPGDVIKFANVPTGGPTDAGLRLVGNLRLRF